MTVAEVCDHFVHRELAKDNTWRSYSTKKTYKTYLGGWIVPHWGAVLRCAKIRGLLSVLFNHACK